MEHLKKAILEKAFSDGEKTKLSCEQALKIADDFNVSPAVIGDLCNSEKIKICQCRLNCFK
ncbi:MAG: hypothetical protein MUC65_05325 [Pontiellaceae bacterium]|nr:hypothetical protein [Pontiellaceae bacterium]